MTDSSAGCCPIVELRQYTLHRGQRDVLIDLFDAEFVETQEAVGMSVLGQFRDLRDPDRFVWLRGFTNMEARRQALTAFYLESAAWRTHGQAASATMIDSSNALLLRPAADESGFRLHQRDRPGPEGDPTNSRVLATICYRDEPVAAEFLRFFEQRLRPVLAEAGGPPIACFETEPAPNNFPRLPVRTGVNVFVWFASFPDQHAFEKYNAALAAAPAWRDELEPALLSRLGWTSEHLLLEPTGRSLLR